jgi:hypothetical protein
VAIVFTRRILTRIDDRATLPHRSRSISKEAIMSQALDPVTQHHVRQAADALGDEFAGVFSRETIERYIAESVTCWVRAGSTCSSPCSRIASRASG